MSQYIHLIHPQANCESKSVGDGTRIWAHAHVLPGAVIGRDCNLGEQVFVENRVVIGDGCTVKNGNALWDLVTLEDHVFIGPDCVFTNELRPRAFLKLGVDHFLPTRICRGATIGANSVIVCGVTVGEFALVGAGSVVTKDVPPHTLVFGNPARAVERICFCGAGLDANDFCRACALPLGENSLERSIARHTPAAKSP